MGSKNRIAKYILPIILKGNEDKKYFYDLTVGGCNLLDKVSGKYKKIGVDNNNYLIELLKKIRDDVESLPILTKEEYIEIKNNKDNYDGWLVGWCGFGHSYNGKWFAGFAGEITTKENTKRDYREEALRGIKRQSAKLQDIDFICSSYDEIELNKNSMIYIDPPYANTTKYKDKFDHDKFWKWVRKKSLEGYCIFVSEYTAPNDFECLWEKEINSSLTKDTGSKKGIEKLFKYKY